MPVEHSLATFLKRRLWQAEGMDPPQSVLLMMKGCTVRLVEVHSDFLLVEDSPEIPMADRRYNILPFATLEPLRLL